MYVQSGLGRRGMGDTVVTDPVTGAVKVVTSAPITTDTVTSSGANVFTDSSGSIFATDSSLTSWMNNNSTLLVVAAVAFGGLLLFAKAGR